MSKFHCYNKKEGEIILSILPETKIPKETNLGTKFHFKSRRTDGQEKLY